MSTATGNLRWHFMGGWITLLVSGLFLFAGIGVGVGAWTSLESEQNFAKEGVATTAKVTAKTTRQERSRRSTRTVYVVSYRYEVDGKPYQGRADVPRADWEALLINGQLPIEYLRSDPSQSRLTLDGGGFHFGTVTILFGVSVICLVVGLAIAFFTWRKASAKIDFLSSGDVVRGTVVEIQPRQEGKVANHYLIYAFRDASGQEVRGEEGPLSRRLYKRWAQAGQPIGVIVDPHDPSKHMADLFEARAQEWAR